LSYWSAGQRVPEDLEIATPERLASFLTAQHYQIPQSHEPLAPPLTRMNPVAAAAAPNER
jgi:flagellar biosynthesis protein FlhF